MNKKYINTDKAPTPGAYSQAVALIYLDRIEIKLAGQTGNIPPSEDSEEPVVEGGIGPQTTQALNNLLAIVSVLGGRADHFVKLEVLLKDPLAPELRKKQREEFNTAYREFFQNHDVDRLPARVMYWVPEVPLEHPAEDTLIEIHGEAMLF
ncbi:MAG: Rid family hydrolase [bacterium]|nr:Rid family hydrolase [bacterium]